MTILRKNGRRQHVQGFTLIEILVASVILFSSIATVSMVYRGAFLSSERANKHVNVTAVLPAILAIIKNEIQIQSNSTEVTLNNKSSAWAVNYHWQASLLAFKTAPPLFDVDSGKMSTPPKKYKLWLVNLTLESNGLTKRFQFNEYSWTHD